MDTLVIIPTYEEAENIGPLAEALLALPLAAEILVVDDASPDGTGEIADALSAHEPRVHVLHRPGKRGLGTAYADGMEWGLAQGAQRLVTMDADFSHDPVYLPALVEASQRFDVVIGSRYVPGGGCRNWGVGRRFLSKSANILARRILALPVRDCTAGMRCYGRRVIERIDPRSITAHGYSYLEEMLYRCHRAGFSIGEVPIVFADRRAGRSKISKTEIARAAATLVRLRLARRDDDAAEAGAEANQ